MNDIEFENKSFNEMIEELIRFSPSEDARVNEMEVRKEQKQIIDFLRLKILKSILFKQSKPIFERDCSFKITEIVDS